MAEPTYDGADLVADLPTLKELTEADVRQIVREEIAKTNMSVSVGSSKAFAISVGESIRLGRT